MGWSQSRQLPHPTGQTIAYNAQGMISTFSDTHGNSGTYSYDADNQRVRKDANGAWTENVEFGGNIIAEKNSDGSWTDYIYANGKRIAKATGSTSSGTQYYHADHLGTARPMTSSTAALLSNPGPQRLRPLQSLGWNCTYTPYGAEQPCSPSNPDNHYKFTGKERDAESGLDYFGARYASSSLGRFMSPDYDDDNDEIEPVPYANLQNPQTLNLYSYVVNNPLSKTDATGHTHQECGADTSSTNPTTGAVTVTAHCQDVPDWWNVWTNLMNARQRAAGSSWTIRAVSQAPMPMEIPSSIRNGM